LSWDAAGAALRFEPPPGLLERALGEEGEAALCLGTLQLVVSRDTGEVLFPWGYLPPGAWKDARVAPPASAPGVLELVEPAPRELLRAAGHDVTDRAWTVEADRRSGWLRLTCGQGAGGEALEFAPGCLAGLDGEGRLVALHLRPEGGLPPA
jgi:hypothetical protein